MNLTGNICSAFPHTRRKPIRKTAPGEVITSRTVNRWIEAINDSKEAKS